MPSSADTGILGASAGLAAGDGGGEDDSTCLFDVYESLSYSDYTGSCAFSDIADGTTLTPALPTTLGLRVTGVGDLPLPLSDFHAKTLKSNPNTRVVEDGSYTTRSTQWILGGSR